MCGIAGIISPNINMVQKRLLQQMSSSIAHRGPDGDGYWINSNNTVGLSHRRLAIIDLSIAGAQPMHYADKLSIVFNGEIYNYLELKSDLQKAGYFFNTASDTEVILAAYDFYKADCVKYFDGMFAFAIWDESNRTLFCARDTFGEKPFYYFIDKDVFAFAGEMKALWAIGVPKTADEKMMVNFISLGQLQNPSNKTQTFYKEIYSLPPAHTATLDFENMEFSLHKYRDINKEFSVKITEDDAAAKLMHLLNSSVKRRLRSDVPVGCSLSGGLDSSSIAHIISTSKTNESFKTFSAVFPGFEKDESALIKNTTAKYGFSNYSITPTANDLISDFEKLSYHQEEPIASASVFTQYKVYQLAKENNTKVLLDGQGADEILGGYTKYIHWHLQNLVSHFKFNEAKKLRLAFLKNKVAIPWSIKNGVAGFLPAHTALALEKREYKKITLHHPFSKDIMQCIRGNEGLGIYKPIVTKLNDLLYFNTLQMGLEELLRYADRNSMAHGVEVRLPFLNVELVKFIFSLPASFKIKNGFTKYIFRKAMADYLPESIVWNPIKTGFEPPQKDWLSNDTLQDYIYEAKQKLVNEKILNPSVLNNKVKPMNAHDANNNDWRYLSLAAVI